MSMNTLNRTLQVAYPTAIFTALIASIGMSLVQASNSDLKRFFPNHGHDHYKRAGGTTEVVACLHPDHHQRSSDSQACTDPSDMRWNSHSSDVQRRVHGITESNESS